MEDLHVMIDIEALGKDPDSRIVAIAAVAFEGETPAVLVDQLVDIHSQAGRSFDSHTVEWWLEQPEEVREQVTGDGGRMHLAEVLHALSAAIRDFRRLVLVDGVWADVWAGKESERGLQVWAKSPTYDLAILRHAYEQLGLPCPWTFREERDVRTLKAQCPRELCPYPGDGAHLALSDCLVQIQHVVACWGFLGNPVSKAGLDSREAKAMAPGRTPQGVCEECTGDGLFDGPGGELGAGGFCATCGGRGGTDPGAIARQRDWDAATCAALDGRSEPKVGGPIELEEGDRVLTPCGEWWDAIAGSEVTTDIMVIRGRGPAARVIWALNSDEMSHV